MPEAILKVLPTSEMCLVWDRGDMEQPLPYQNLMANIFELYQLFRCHTPTSKKTGIFNLGIFSSPVASSYVWGSTHDGSYLSQRLLIISGLMGSLSWFLSPDFIVTHLPIPSGTKRPLLTSNCSTKQERSLSQMTLRSSHLWKTHHSSPWRSGIFQRPLNCILIDYDILNINTLIKEARRNLD